MIEVIQDRQTILVDTDEDLRRLRSAAFARARKGEAIPLDAFSIVRVSHEELVLKVVQSLQRRSSRTLGGLHG